MHRTTPVSLSVVAILRKNMRFVVSTDLRPDSFWLHLHLTKKNSTTISFSENSQTEFRQRFRHEILRSGFYLFITVSTTKQNSIPKQSHTLNHFWFYSKYCKSFNYFIANRLLCLFVYFLLLNQCTMLYTMILRQINLGVGTYNLPSNCKQINTTHYRTIPTQPIIIFCIHLFHMCHGWFLSSDKLSEFQQSCTNGQRYEVNFFYVGQSLR